LKQERERKLVKIRNKWLETVKYTGMLDEEEFSTGAKKKSHDKDKKNYTD